MLRAIALSLVVAVLGVAAPAEAQQSYPNRPIKLYVGFPPGGSTDLAGRVLAAKLSETLGQPVVIENKAGASGNIAADLVAQAAPDGYTLLLAATSFAAAPAFYDKLSWDPTKDFTPVSLVATVPILVVTSPAISVKTVPELVAYSKANPGKLNLASPGATTLTRLSGEMFKQVAGLDWLTVHYKGGAPALQDMLAGTAHVMFANISDVLAQVRGGKLNAIAVTTPKRSPIVPEIPTLAESGYPDFAFATWQAVVGPSGLPQPIVAKLNAAIRQAVGTEEVKARFADFGTDASASSPEELAGLLKSEVEKIKRVAKSVNATRQ